MAIAKRQLVIKKSQIPGAGKGLFTEKLIRKNGRVVEYEGNVSTWKEADQSGKNRYLMYVDKNNVIDAAKTKDKLGRYANDAKGPTKVENLKNNCQYITYGKKVFICAKRDIQPGEEILVGYGKEYWDNLQ